LNHATPSFDVATKTTTLTIDFGIIPLGGAAATHGFSVANLQSASLAAGLDLNGVTISGSTALSTDIAAFQNEAAGDTHAFTATLSASGGGFFSAMDVVHVSDDHTIAGALGSDLTLNLTGTVALAGDANVDGQVDMSDLSTVLSNFGQPAANWMAGNFDGGGTVDLTDLADVLNNFGRTVAMATAVPSAAPEPSSLVMLGIGAAVLVRRKRR
jgi:hypothetical protein